MGMTWLVKSLDRRPREGYFRRSAVNRGSRNSPLLACEYVAYRLAQELELPVAETRFAEVDGQFGIVSLKHTKRPLMDWQQFVARHSNPFSRIVQPQRLLKVFVFDIWILNIDRNSRNVILYPAGKRDLFDFYVIDHGLTLLGSLAWKRLRWDDEYWSDVQGYNNRYIKGLRTYAVRHQETLREYARQIQSLDNSKISRIVRELPNDLLAGRQRRVLRQLLIGRKRSLLGMVDMWIRRYKIRRARLRRRQRKVLDHPL